MKIILRVNTEIPNGPLLIEFEQWLKARYESKRIRIRREDTSPPSLYSFTVEERPTERVTPEEMEKILKNIRGQSLEDALKSVLEELANQNRLPDDGSPF